MHTCIYIYMPPRMFIREVITVSFDFMLTLFFLRTAGCCFGLFTVVLTHNYPKIAAVQSSVAFSYF